MHKMTVEAPGLTIGSGEVLALTAAQFETRAYSLEVIEDGKGKLTKVRVLAPIQFKAGEELHTERVPKGAVAGEAPKPAKQPVKERRDANGDTPEMAATRRQFDASYAALQTKLEAEVGAFTAKLDAARSEGNAAGRAELLAEVHARNGLFDAAEAAAHAVDAAQAALKTEADPEKRKPLQKALDEALAAQFAADTAVDELEELKA